MRILLLLAVLGVAGCRPPVSAPQAEPVPMRWSLNDSPRADGHRLRVAGGTLHAIPARVRLVRAPAQEIAEASAAFDPGRGLCGDTSGAGTASAELPLSSSDAAAFRGGWPTGYVIEAQ